MNTTPKQKVFDSHLQALDALKKREVDYLLSNTVNLDIFFKDLWIDKLPVIRGHFDYRVEYYAFHNTEHGQKLKELWEQVWETAMKDGRFVTIMRKYNEMEGGQQMLDSMNLILKAFAGYYEQHFPSLMKYGL